MKRFIAILFTALLCLLPLPVLAAQVGTITAVSGEVSWRAQSNIPYKPLAKGASVGEGNWLKTGANGWIELTLKDKSKFTLANNTEFEITSFLLTKDNRAGSFNLAQGKLRASVVKFGGKQSGMTVKSGTAVAGIKGTEFLMLSQGQANLFFGNEGRVEISGDDQRQQQSLTPGTMTQNTRGITPIKPLVVEPGTPLAEAKDVFDQITAASPPAEWIDSGRIADIIARWNINYGHYLADSGKYDEALHVFQIALDLTDIAYLRADAHLERGAVYARFLANPEQALAAYLLVLEEYPQLAQAETALFNASQTLLDMGFAEQARQRFEQYLRSYPDGRYVSTAETLLKSIQ